MTEGTYYIIADIFTDSFTPGDYILNVTSDVNSTIPQSNAGGNQELCENTTILNANTLQEDETGTWIVISGNAVFDDINNPNAIVSELNTGDNILEWIVEAECSEEIASSQIIINVDQPPSSDAGENQDLCENLASFYSIRRGKNVKDLTVTVSLRSVTQSAWRRRIEIDQTIHAGMELSAL